MDKLIVRGLGAIDGEYECDLIGMLSPGATETLTNLEGRRIKLMTGIRQGELDEALTAGDNDVLVALAAIVLTRAGKFFDEQTLWNAPMGSGLDWLIAARAGDADPPASTPPPSEKQSRSGGGSSSPTSVSHPGNHQSGIGTRDSETRTWDPDYDPAISPI